MVSTPAFQPGEEEMREVFDRLCERFPTFTPERVLQILRENGGHAGQAAGVLRDLSGTGVRPVDPDDAEHVRTLLSSPAMFAHACKEYFVKFDVNSDGALQWAEIVELVNALYDNFGLPPPREGGLRAFFEASDTNGDGVLSEKEFHRFFECFLRYAFFDVVTNEKQQHQPLQQNYTTAEEVRPESSGDEVRQKEAKSSPKRESRKSRGGEEEATPPQRKSEKPERESKRKVAGEGKFFQCSAPSGCSYRQSTDYQDRANMGVPKGEVVQALECWIRTPQGWLPVSLESGETLFEPCDAAKAAEQGIYDANVRARGSPKKEGERAKRSSKREEDGEGRRMRRDSSTPAGGGSKPGLFPHEMSMSPDTKLHAGDNTSNLFSHERPSSGAGNRPSSGAGNRGLFPHELATPVGRNSKQQGLLPHEEEWRQVFDRLQTRFPEACANDVAEALRLTDGHAGQAATKLRE